MANSNDVLAYIAECIQKALETGEGTIIDLDLENPKTNEVKRIVVQVSVDEDPLITMMDMTNGGGLLH